MATIYVDNQAYTVKDGTDVLTACLGLGLDLPYFCWHPKLHSVGACRQCAVKLFRDEKDKKGKIAMACMTPVKDGMRLSVDDEEARKFRAGIVELLMTSHPHDCPVCDEGGECHLQDMTVMTGHDYRRYRFAKRTHRNQDLGPLVAHEMNRCIQCYRCTRFYNEFAGGRDFGVQGWHHHVYFGRAADGPLESPFSGNLVEICPTGVFTDKTLGAHYTRKWDLQTAASVCVHCGVGCNTLPGERYGGLRRIRNRYNAQVNGYFLCDRGRYGYEFVNSARRLRGPLLRGADGKLAVAGREAALAALAKALAGGGAIGVGSPRASLESNYALRALVGAERFVAGLSRRQWRLAQETLHVLAGSPAHSASGQEIQAADAVLVLGEDVTQAAPILALSLRQAARQGPIAEAVKAQHIARWNSDAVRDAIQGAHGPFYVATPRATDLDELASVAVRGGPADIARLGLAVAAALRPATAPAVADLDAATKELAERIAADLLAAHRPVVVAGPSCGSEAVMQAAANVAHALVAREKPAELCLLTEECNTLGLAMLAEADLEDALSRLTRGEAETLVILENDLYRRADAAWVDGLLAAAKSVIVLDCLVTPTAAKADVALPAATFAEATGTLVNNEGRAQRFFQVFAPEGEIAPSWRWLSAAAAGGGRWANLDALIAEMCAAMPALSAVREAAPGAEYRSYGRKAARQLRNSSGRTAMHADRDIHERRPPEDADSPMAFSMEGAQRHVPPSLLCHYWMPGWNSVQALNKLQQEIGGLTRGGPIGKRLIDKDRPQRGEYYREIPAAFERRAGQWLVVGSRHVMGSEELSALAPAVAELAARPYVAMNASDAKSIGAAEGAKLAVKVGGQTLHLALKMDESLPAGVAAMPVGLADMAVAELPAWAEIAPEKEGA